MLRISDAGKGGSVSFTPTRLEWTRSSMVERCVYIAKVRGSKPLGSTINYFKFKMTEKGTFTLKSGLARMLKGGVIMDVVNAEHAKIAEKAGAVAVMALERVPSDIRADGGVARMSDPI